MSIKLTVTMTDSAPPAPFEPPLVATAEYDIEDTVPMVVEGVVDRVSLQSYLMLMTEPVADQYELILSTPPDLDEELTYEETGEEIVEEEALLPKVPLTISN